MKRNHVDIITLGCSKNLVDSEILMKQFENNGYSCDHDSENPEGEIAIINTCGFIGDAKEESINTILEFAERKKKGELKKLFVMGCLSQRYKSELENELPEVDKYYGKFDYKQVLVDLGVVQSIPESVSRVITTPNHYAYIKISEGCDRHCAYCAIPIITGKHISRPKDEILCEIKELVSQGVKEFQIIAQELTFYGRDFDGKSHIAELVSDISDIEGVEWIRLHYAYPAQFPLELLDVITSARELLHHGPGRLGIVPKARFGRTRLETSDLFAPPLCRIGHPLTRRKPLDADEPVRTSGRKLLDQRRLADAATPTTRHQHAVVTSPQRLKVFQIAFSSNKHTLSSAKRALLSHRFAPLVNRNFSSN